MLFLAGWLADVTAGRQRSRSVRTYNLKDG